VRAGFAIFGLCIVTFAQPTTFEIASVKVSSRTVGPDYNNQLIMSPTQLIGHNVTLRRLVAEAYSVQMNQVAGPAWLDENEFEIEAHAGSEGDRDRLRAMLRTLLKERFHLREHAEQRTMRVYELTTDKGGPKFSVAKDAARAAPTAGFPFHGDMRQLADLIALQLTISAAPDPDRPGLAGGAPPVVLNKTGVQGVYYLAIDIRPEPGSDMFTLWQRFARERLGLRLESGRGSVDVVVVDGAERSPEPN